jgi:hypothetical protein
MGLAASCEVEGSAGGAGGMRKFSWFSTSCTMVSGVAGLEEPKWASSRSDCSFARSMRRARLPPRVRMPVVAVRRVMEWIWGVVVRVCSWVWMVLS